MNDNIVVVDANIAAKLAVTEHDSATAIALFDGWKKQKRVILVPALFIYEVTNILLKQVLRNKMTFEDVKKAALAILDIDVDIYWPVDPEVSMDALVLAHIHKLPATYDAHYLALAKREECEFWTADERLYNSVKDQFSWVRLMVEPPTTATLA